MKVRDPQRGERASGVLKEEVGVWSSQGGEKDKRVCLFYS